MMAVIYRWGVTSKAGLATWKENREKKRQARLEIQGQLEIIEAYVQTYDWESTSSLEKAYKDAPISKRLVKELDELTKLASEYFGWRYECFKVINAEVRAQSKQFSTLNDAIRLVYHSNLEGMFSGTEGSASYGIYKAIYKGELTFDMAKESILEGNWDREIVIQGKNIMFSDIINGGGVNINLFNISQPLNIIQPRPADNPYLCLRH